MTVQEESKVLERNRDVVAAKSHTIPYRHVIRVLYEGQ